MEYPEKTVYIDENGVEQKHYYTANDVYDYLSEKDGVFAVPTTEDGSLDFDFAYGINKNLETVAVEKRTTIGHEVVLEHLYVQAYNWSGDSTPSSEDDVLAITGYVSSSLMDDIEVYKSQGGDPICENEELNIWTLPWNMVFSEDDDVEIFYYLNGD